MPARFVPLHLHSEYSLVDSTIRIPELVAACASRGLPAVAITDQNNLFALVKFYKEAENVGIKPIAGADVLIAEGTAAPSRLTLLCRDREGYLSLSQTAHPYLDARPSRRWGGRAPRVVVRERRPVRARRSAIGTRAAVRIRPPRPGRTGPRRPAGEVRRAPAPGTAAHRPRRRGRLQCVRAGRGGTPRHPGGRQQRRALPRCRRLRRARGARLHRQRPGARRQPPPARLQRRSST